MNPRPSGKGLGPTSAQEPPKVYLSRFKCFVRISEGHLEISRETGTGETIDDRYFRRWEAVSHPVGQEFLDHVNRLLGSGYTERDFYLESLNAKSRPPTFYNR